MIDLFNKNFVVHENTSVFHLKKHPKYYAAKNGDLQAALQIVKSHISQQFLNEMRCKYHNCTLLPVMGKNMLPLALAIEIGLPVCTNVRIAANQKRESMYALERLINSPKFCGKIQSTNYVVVDDIIMQGGTVNSLYNYVQSNGGKCKAAIVLAVSVGKKLMPTCQENLQILKVTFKNELQSIISKCGLECEINTLTNSQISYLLRFSV